MIGRKSAFLSFYPACLKPSCGGFPWDFGYESWYQKIRLPVSGLLGVESSVIVGLCSLVLSEYQRVTDGQTDTLPMPMSRSSRQEAQLSLTDRSMLVCKVVEVWQDFLSEYIDKKFTYICYTDG